MKKIYLYLIVITSVLIHSCTEMNDLHEGYLEEGETIYAAKVDSAAALAGDNRIQLDLIIESQRIDFVRIYWNDYTDSSDVAIGNQIGTFSHVIDNMEERSYIFQCMSFDKFGNPSLPYEVTGKVYGDNYRTQLSNRRVSMEQVDTETATSVILLNWTILSSLDQGVMLEYTDALGNLVQTMVPADETKTYIESWKSEGTIKYSTVYKPEETAVDVFEAEQMEMSFPLRVLQLDRGLWQKVVLPTDGVFDCYGGSIENLWDGGRDTWYHSNCVLDGTDGVPHHFTLDLGVTAELTSFLVTPRQSRNTRNPKHFQIWGRADLDGAETTAAPTDPDWDVDAEAKGWILIHEEFCDESWNGSNADYEVEIGNDTPVRYIRFRVLETFDGGQQTALSEFEFWASSIQ
ncbi:DUF4998 domain-containing protein [Mangrovibacterium sp.]|uniref:DUF4998 domain-containing protein n=1 Tax=Mangrovibacterium sp. TaxID=1961364 RepID=UPI003566E698